MSQQEFESPRQRPDEEIYQPQYPYAWSDQVEQEGMPRDEPPINYSAQMGRDGAPARAQVPWWARPQPQQNSRLGLVGLVLLLILLASVMGGLGLVGVILGGIAHLLGIILVAILALLLFVFLLVIIIVSLIGRALSRAFGGSSRGNRPWQNRP
jgi:hypothetical protein